MQIVQTTDCDTLARLNRHVHEIHVQLYPAYFKEYEYEPIKQFFAAMVTKPSHVFFLAEEQGEPVGYAWIELKTSAGNAFMNPYRSVFIHQISISQSYRSQGYGSRLLETIDEFARNNEAAKVELDYWTANAMVRDFYAKNGYTIYRQFVYKDL